MRLTLVVSDCPPVIAGVDPSGAPPLPALSALLRAADREQGSRDWREALCERFAPPPLAGCAPAVIACAALPGVQASHAVLASPVHLLATPDHLRMPADGLLRLEPDEGRRLEHDFDQVFAGEGLALRFACGRFVLTGLPGGEGVGDPAAMLGSRLAPPAGVDPAWRRLSSEIELWLHAHEINRARAARGRASVDALWLWGGGALPASWPRAPASRATEFVGDDVFVAGLAALSGSSLRSVPTPMAGVLQGADVERVLQVAVAPTAREGATTLASLDAGLVAPALEALRAGELEVMHLLFDRVQARLTRRNLARFWRRRRPWWEHLRR